MTIPRLYSEANYLEETFDSGDPIVENFLRTGQVALLVAPQKSAKTIVSLQLALSVAHGVPLFGVHRVDQPRRVLAFTFENTDHEIQSLLRRIRQGMGLERTTDNLLLARTPMLHVSQKESFRALYKIVEDFRPDLLILDPLYRVHLGSPDNAGEVQITTGALNIIGQEFNPALWIPHHEHRARLDQFGSNYEKNSERYAGSWAWSAWCSLMYGFKFNLEKHEASLLTYVDRGGRQVAEATSLVLHDTEEQLCFEVSATTKVRAAIPHVIGMNIRQAAEFVGVHHETMRRALDAAAKAGEIVLVRGGAGRESMIQLPGEL